MFDPEDEERILEGPVRWALKLEWIDLEESLDVKVEKTAQKTREGAVSKWKRVEKEETQTNDFPLSERDNSDEPMQQKWRSQISNVTL